MQTIQRATICWMKKKGGFSFDFGLKQEVSCSENEMSINTDEQRTSADEATVSESARESSRIRKPPERYGYDELLTQ